MKIFLLATGFPPTIGGLQNFNAQAASALFRQGHELTVAVSEDCNGDSCSLRTQNPWPFPVFHLPVDEGVLSVKELSSLLSNFQPDLVLVSGASGRRRWLLKIFEDREIPSLLFFHGLGNKRFKENPIQRFFTKRRFGINRAALVLANSQFLSKKILEMGVPKEKLKVIYPGVSLERFHSSEQERNLAREKLMLGDRSVMLSVSRLAPGKGQDRVIRAMPAILQKDSSLLYLIVGAGTSQNALESLVKELGLQNSVRFEGRQENPLPYFQAADFFVQPSFLEGKLTEAFGLVFLEASACSLPSIACRESGAEEIIVHGETGFLVSPRSNQDLQECLEKLISQKERCKKMGEAARKRVEECFDWGQTANQLEAALSQVHASATLIPTR